MPLPSALLDAHFLEEQTGDGRLGPSDFAAFYALTVAPADLPAWRAALPQPQPWWVGEDALDSLEFYSPKLLTGSSNGWVGLAPDGRIFVYVFTL